MFPFMTKFSNNNVEENSLSFALWFYSFVILVTFSSLVQLDTSKL